MLYDYNSVLCAQVQLSAPVYSDNSETGLESKMLNEIISNMVCDLAWYWRRRQRNNKKVSHTIR